MSQFLFIQHNSSLLSTWPNHLNLFHCITSAMSSIASMLLTHSLFSFHLNSFLSSISTSSFHLLQMKLLSTLFQRAFHSAAPCMNSLYTLCAPNGVPTNTLQTNTAWVLHINYNLCCTCTKGFTHHFGFLFIYFEAFILKALIPFPQFFSSSSHFPTSTRSSAYSISQGRHSLTLCVTASITIMKSSGLSTEPWCNPTFTPNHTLTHPPYDLILVVACLYMATTALTNHSSTPNFLMAHSTTFLATPAKGLL